MIVSYKIDQETEEILDRLGIHIIKTQEVTNLPVEVSDHPDMVILPIRKDLFIVEKNQLNYYREMLKDYNINLIPSENSIHKKYPEDILLNFGVLKDSYIGRTDKVDPVAKYYLKENNKRGIYVPQGYGNCSIIRYQDKVITQDKSIYKALKMNDIEVHLLPQGGISLPGYSTGFIGGTYGMINDTTMIFYGNLDRYVFRDQLKEFLEKDSMTLFYPKNVDFIDRGSMIGIY